MNKSFMKKLLSVFLALTMVLTSAPIKGSAEIPESTQETEVEQMSQNLVDLENTTEEGSKKSGVATFIKNGLSVLAAGAAVVLGFLYYKAQNDFNALKGQDDSKKIAELQGQIKEQKTTIDSLKAQGQENQNQITNYVRKNEDQQKKLNNLSNQVKEKDGEINSCQSDLNRCKKDVELFKESNGNSTITLLHGNLSACQENLTLWKNYLDTCNKEKDGLIAQIQDYNMNEKDPENNGLEEYTNDEPQNKDYSPVFVPEFIESWVTGCFTFSNLPKTFAKGVGRSERLESLRMRGFKLLKWKIACYGFNWLWRKTGLESTSNYFWYAMGYAMDSVKSSKAWNGTKYGVGKALNGVGTAWDYTGGKLWSSIRKVNKTTDYEGQQPTETPGLTGTTELTRTPEPTPAAEN